MRVVIVAANVSTRFGGEPILPWHYFRFLRKRGIEAWLVAHARTRPELLSLLPHEAGRMRFVPDLLLQRWLNWCSRPLPERVTVVTLGWGIHLLTSIMQRRIVREMVRTHQIDIVHEPIPVSPKQPSLMYGLCAAVVIGPMNGGMNFPPAFARSEGLLERIVVSAGRSASDTLNRLMPGKRRAAVLLVANQRTRRALPKSIRGRVIELVENGVDLELFNNHDAPIRTGAERTKFAFVGRLIPWKGVDMLLEAAASASGRSDFEIHIVGDGPLRERLISQAQSLNLGDRVVFHGFQPQSECARLLAGCDALVLPSLYECGGAVVLEAMAMGLPVIATRWGGPIDYLDESSGILIAPVDRQRFVSDLADAIVQLAQSPERRRQLGAAGRNRVVSDFDWEKKIDRMIEIYSECLSNHDGRQ